MALKDIIEKIMGEAKAEAAAIAEAGERDYNGMLEQKNQEIVAELAGLKKRHLEKVAKIEEQAEFRARLLKKNASLRSKQALLEEVFKEVKKGLAGLKDRDYERLLMKILKETPRLENAEIITPPRRNAAVKKALAAAGASYRLSGRRLAEGEEGFILSSPTIEINNTVSNYVETRRKEFEAEAARALFA